MKRIVLFIILLLTLTLTACNALQGSDASDDEVSDATAPVVVIDSPPSGAETNVGEEVEVQATGTDDIGVARLDLQVDGVVVASETTPDPDGQASYSVLLRWMPDAVGEYTLSVIAYRADGTASPPSSITVVVTEETESNDEEATGSDSGSDSITCNVKVNSELNARSGPGVNYGVQGTVAANTELTVIGRSSDGGWYQVQYGGADAWVSAPYTTISSGDCNAVPTASSSAAGGSSGGTSGGSSSGQHSGGNNNGQTGDNPTPMPTNASPTEEVTETVTNEPTVEVTEESTEEPPTGGKVAPFDNDSLFNPAYDLSGKQASYSNEISAPEGDNDDWVSFAAGIGNNQGTITMWFSLACTGDTLHSNGKTVIVRAQILDADTGQAVSGATFWCGITDKQIGLPENRDYVIRIYYSGQEDQSYAQFTVTLKRSQF